MLQSLDEIAAGSQLAGLVAGGPVTILAVETHGPTSATVTFRGHDGKPDDSLITSGDLSRLSIVTQDRWTFDADGDMFRLASEARRMKFAHLADPFAAVDTSAIEPYPHQIDAVYNRFLEQRPIRFLLADDPGAGKTIMSGLLIRELMMRGDVARCLIVAPGSLVEQWQDELWEKFQLSFDLMSRAKVEESRTGNPFTERNLLIARVDQLSRADDLIEKLKVTDWDLVIVDEAHKMSAHLYGNELKKTRRFELGEVLRDRARHLLLLSATPHNGKNEDFLAFMTLLDPERFAGRIRDDKVPDVSDVMRRLVKENLLTFDGKRLFPPRTASSPRFQLSGLEEDLYNAVTSYVKDGMNRADKLAEGGDKRRGVIVGFALAGLQRRLASSPEAIFQSLRRRHERLTKQRDELRHIAKGSGVIKVADLPKGISLSDLENFDYDDFDDEELEELEDVVIDTASAAASADELDAELAELAILVELASNVRASRQDTKWLELRSLLRSDEFNDPKGNRKLIVFSEHKDTLTYVTERIRDELGKPESVVTIHGGMRRHDRREIQDRFRVDPTVRVLVATDAAGEGVNLQVANLMVNYDLPWNPNRIEQRFGRIHRIGQQLPCHLWNLVAENTREGKVFERLFQKIEEQRKTYGDQVYDVLGDPELNVSLQDLLIKAIKEDEEAVRTRFMDEVIDADIGAHLDSVLRERALISGLGQKANNDTIKEHMERAKARKLQPWFVDTFFRYAVNLYGGRITQREPHRYEITRLPASIRTHADPLLGPVHDRYSRVTFDKRAVSSDTGESAELVSPGTPLLTAVINTVLHDHGDTLEQGAMLIDHDPDATEPRLLVYIDHAITDGRTINGQRMTVSRQFQYIEINRNHVVSHPGPEPYLGYSAATNEQRDLVKARLPLDWADQSAETAARNWAIEHLAGPHLETIADVTRDRVERVRAAVKARLTAEITYWDRRTEELKAQELAGKKPRLNSGRARQRADDLEARLTRRNLDLDLEAALQNNPPTVVGAALVIPVRLLDELAGVPQPPVEIVNDPMETDRRAMDAVMKAEAALGRQPKRMAHFNPGYDIESRDANGTLFLIEVKGHLPHNPEIHVSAQQVQKAKSNPDVWKLAIVSVPMEPDVEPQVKYLVEPFKNTQTDFAQPYVPLTVKKILTEAKDPF